MDIESLVGILVFVLNTWWLLVPSYFILSLLIVRLLNFNVTATVGIIAFGIILFIILLVFAPTITAPLVNHYGKLAVGEVTSSKKMFIRNADYSPKYSIRDAFTTQDGKEQEIKYWDSTWRVYPVFESIYFPESVGNLFYLKLGSI